MANSLPPNISKLKKNRIAISENLECDSYPITQVFDFLEKNSGLTEEFIYNNTNPLLKQLLSEF